MKYIYFVSYTGKDSEGNKIFGHLELTRNKEITSIDDIEEIEDVFHNGNGYNILVLNYILMRKEEE